VISLLFVNIITLILEKIQ